MHKRIERAFGINGRAILTPSTLRPWRMVDLTRLLLAVIYCLASFAFADLKPEAEWIEHGIVLGMLALAVAALMLSSRSWVTDMRIRKPVVCLDAVLFLALLIATNASNSPYFSGIFFIVVEMALVVPRRYHLLVGLVGSGSALLALLIERAVAVPVEPELERSALKVLYILATVLITGVLLGPRRETLLQQAQEKRLLDSGLPPANAGHGAYLVQALHIATGGDRAALLFRLASHEKFRFACDTGNETLPQDVPILLSAGTGWQDRTRDASIFLSRDGVATLGRLTRGGRAWCALLDADKALTIRLALGTFEAVGAVHLEDPCHEDRAAIARRVFESLCEELLIRHGLDLAHVIAGARERERLQRDLHDSVLQALASIRFQAAPLLAGQDVDPRPVLHNIDRIAKDQSATIRQIINPDVSEDDFAYLPETLALVVRSLGEQWGIRCDLTVQDGNCATSAMIGRELSFAVREIVANAVRHAGARAIDFLLEPDGNRIVLNVTDDGVPNIARLGASEAVHSRSLMRRIQTLGGEVFLRNIGGRTMIRISIPRK